MSKRELKKQLEMLDKKKLISLISDLYDKNKSVKEYLDYFANPNEKETLEIYKTKVREAFYPKCGFGFKLANGKKAISDFRKLNPSSKSLVDLLMCYVESGVEFTNDYGDINEGFYSSIESVYHNAMKLIDKNGLHNNYKIRAHNILNETKNIGWGFHDTLSDSYYDIYD
ncbi:MAG: DUF6155 family protein [Bacilli bacterium]|jgi:hypothetical protein|nr:DUF6155 family protein [Bacteroidales bacterium]MDD4673167.1 DUF6155 family protein [Bacteroidales bacterium]MDY0161411.1 DUF6155 family protein [Bacteroidales bacterium]